MPFQKGNTYGKGRPKGYASKLQVQDKEVLRKVFINDLIPTLKRDIKKLSPTARVNVILKLAEFFIPKLRATYLEADIDGISDQTAGRIISEVLKQSLDGSKVHYQKSESGSIDPGANLN